MTVALVNQGGARLSRPSQAEVAPAIGSSSACGRSTSCLPATAIAT